jgi:ribonuclease BN (tRNA processing enzyme)
MTTGDVTVTVLGSGDAFASGGRFHTCFMVEAPGSRHLIDCGASAPVSMKRHGVDSSAIDAVVISHLHGDHFGGIPFLALDAQYLSGRKKPLVVAGPPGVAERVPSAMEGMYPGLFSREMSFVIEYVEIRAGEPTDVAGAVVTAYAARHSAGESPAHSLRVGIAGKTVAYSGDTGWSETLVEVAAGADLFICEASHYDEDTEGHLSYQTLVRRRADFDSKRMILTHMGDEVLDRLESLEIETASDGMRINL